MKIIEIITILLLLVSIATALWYFFGNSPSLEQALMIFFITGLFAIGTKLSAVSTKLNMIERSFSCLAKDFKEYTKK